MHIGNYLKECIKRERYSLKQIGELINKSPEGVKKDLDKEKVSMSVLESYANALDINFYELLAKEWNSVHNLPEPEFSTEQEVTMAWEEPGEYKKTIHKKQDEELSVTIRLKGKKKDKILKLLFEDL